ncbi:DUF6567 family protein [Jiulongibacter sediminis]|jgi:hypothetical protein|uniref:DUF6567 family protein n=1 Tax=Jiulongibacter sediminis TaxID=1605367 RepID=UPI0026F23615|nr:DUF6567 family protein [Jiulongibacter sediminis]
MKKTNKFMMGLVLMAGLSSCGVNHSWILNQNQNQTQVHLGDRNFKTLGRVQGTAEVEYALLFGGVKKKQLYSKAYAQMLENAGLEQGARAVTNVITEEHLGGAPPFYTKRTLTVSASLVEFTD